MDYEQMKDHFDTRFDRVEAKLDNQEAKLTNHLERLSKAEESITWLQGHVKIVTAMGISLVGFLATVLWDYITKR